MRNTLLDFFDDVFTSPAEFVVHDTGYRSWTYSYEQVKHAAIAFAGRLRTSGIHKGDKVVVWGENRAEWIVALWGCVVEGVIVVPIDYRASADLVDRIQRIVESRVIVIGDDVQPKTSPGGPSLWRMADVEWPATAAALDRPLINPDDTAEIIFTSGATGDPKGVVITHRNILANIVPIEHEVAKYRRYARPFSPIRFLDLLPLSHMFGQAMATFVPPMLPGVVVFMRGFNPGEIVRQIHSRRITVLICVPKMLDVLRGYIQQQLPETREETKSAGSWHVLSRVWRHRKVHRLLGWKFWAFVVGAAPLERDLEEFWSRLGFVVVQGYGLTETAPVVTLNNPFKPARGTVGTPIAGVEVKIAPDGEILVRGPNVTPGYYHAEVQTAEAFTEGWFHTGDIGEMDASGRLVVRGRKKEMIVTPEGLHVFPEDVERVLDDLPGVRESAVVGLTHNGQERVHAVLALEPGANQDEIVRQANTKLEEHQKIRSASVWTGDGLPRTEGTRKLRRREVKRWAESGGALAPRAPTAAAHSVASVVGELARRDNLTATTTLDELGLSSLERVELMTLIEERLDTTIDEAAFSSARTVGDLEALVSQAPSEAPPAEPAAQVPPSARSAAPGAPAPRAGPAQGPKRTEHPERITFPRWNRSRLARGVRRAALSIWLLPLTRLFAWIHVHGVEHLQSVKGPVIFASNHQSHMDTPVILAALPASWRYQVAPAMAKDFFEAHFYPERHTTGEVLINRSAYSLAALLFNAFPLPRREAGTRDTLRYIGDLISAGISVLIFPEGHISDRSEIKAFQPGIGMMAARLNVPVIPVRLEGVDRVLHRSWNMAHPGRVDVTFGPPLTLKGDDYIALAKQVEDAVRSLRNHVQVAA